MTAETYLKSVEDRLAKATQARLECQIPALTGEYPRGRIKGLKITGKLYGSPMLPIGDAELHAHAPEDLRKLCAALRVAVEGLKDSRDYVDEMECRGDEDCDHCLIVHQTMDPALQRIDAILGGRE